MEIYLNDNDNENIKVTVTDYDKNIEDAEDLLFNLGKGVATIVGEMVSEIAKEAPLEVKKEFASQILEISRNMVEMFYDDHIEKRDKNEHEAELYDAMRECYTMALKSSDIDEDEMISCAKSSINPDFIVTEEKGAYCCKVKLDTKEFILGMIPIGNLDVELEVECWKASAAAIVLFDKAFPDDRSKHPDVLYHSLNMYYDIIKALREGR